MRTPYRDGVIAVRLSKPETTSVKSEDAGPGRIAVQHAAHS